MNFREEFYLNFIEDDRWRYITRGLGTTFTITFFAVILAVSPVFTSLICLNNTDSGSLLTKENLKSEVSRKSKLAEEGTGLPRWK